MLSERPSNVSAAIIGTYPPCLHLFTGHLFRAFSTFTFSCLWFNSSRVHSYICHQIDHPSAGVRGLPYQSQINNWNSWSKLKNDKLKSIRALTFFCLLPHPRKNVLTLCPVFSKYFISDQMWKTDIIFPAL